MSLSHYFELKGDYKMKDRVKATNRASGSLGYNIPSLRISRFWKRPGEAITLPIEELKELYLTKGGKIIVDELLMLDDEQVYFEITGKSTEPEYKYTEKEIVFLLTEASDAQLFDCLDFAPSGVLSLLETLAITRKPNTTAKIDAINKKFGIDLIKKISFYEEINSNVEEEVPTEQVKRRTAPLELEKKETKPVQKTGYKVISREDK